MTATGTSTPDPLLLRVEEAARLLGISRSATYNLISSGRLPAVHLGKSARVTRAAIEVFVRELQDSDR